MKYVSFILITIFANQNFATNQFLQDRFTKFNRNNLIQIIRNKMHESVN
jgi:hypothetical protein